MCVCVCVCARARARATVLVLLESQVCCARKVCRADSADLDISAQSRTDSVREIRDFMTNCQYCQAIRLYAQFFSSRLTAGAAKSHFYSRDFAP